MLASKVSKLSKARAAKVKKYGVPLMNILDQIERAANSHLDPVRNFVMVNISIHDMKTVLPKLRKMGYKTRKYAMASIDGRLVKVSWED